MTVLKKKEISTLAKLSAFELQQSKTNYLLEAEQET